MNDEQFLNNFERYLDGELDDKLSREMEQYMEANPLAKLHLDEAKKLDSLIRNHCHREEAPYELKEKIIKDLEGAGLFKFFPGFHWLTERPVQALSSIVVPVLILSLIFNFTKPFPVFASSVSSHIEYLKGAYPLEIESNDMDEVLKWFEGKLDFAVNIPRIDKNGVKLVGARLCHLKDRKVAYLMFEKNGQKISAFVMDARNLRVPNSKKMVKAQHTVYVKNANGYRSILCLNKKMTNTGCIFVSDMPEKEFMELLI